MLQIMVDPRRKFGIIAELVVRLWLWMWMGIFTHVIDSHRAMSSK
jgi:hypothetical protein